VEMEGRGYYRGAYEYKVQLKGKGLGVVSLQDTGRAGPESGSFVFKLEGAGLADVPKIVRRSRCEILRR